MGKDSQKGNRRVTSVIYPTTNRDDHTIGGSDDYMVFMIPPINMSTMNLTDDQLLIIQSSDKMENHQLSYCIFMNICVGKNENPNCKINSEK